MQITSLQLKKKVQVTTHLNKVKIILSKTTTTYIIELSYKTKRSSLLLLTRFHQTSYCSKATNAHAIRTMVLISCSAAALHRSPEQQSISHSRPSPLQRSILAVFSHSEAVKQPFSKRSTDAPSPFTWAWPLTQRSKPEGQVISSFTSAQSSQLLELTHL